jgi:hypothetical protein
MRIPTHLHITGPLDASLILSRDEYARLPDAAVYRTRAVPATRVEMIAQQARHMGMTR